MAEFLEACRRKNRWICGLGIEAAAKVCNVDILVWEQREDGTWEIVLQVRAVEGQRRDILPLVWVNDRSHFVTMVRPKDGWPKHWHNDAEAQRKISIRAGGGDDEDFLKRADTNSESSFIKPAQSTLTRSRGGSVQLKRKQSTSSTSFLQRAQTKRSNIATSLRRVASLFSENSPPRKPKQHRFGEEDTVTTTTAKIGKKLRINQAEPGTERSWYCKICKQTLTIRMGKGPNAVRRLSDLRSRHLMKHGGVHLGADNKIRQQQLLCTPSLAVPMEHRSWTCSICNKGLPTMDCPSQLRASVDKHFADEHPGVNRSQEYKRKQREHEPTRNAMSKRGQHVAEVMREKRRELITQVNDETDHFVQPMTMLVNPREHRRGQRETEFSVCKMCLKVMIPARFMDTECKKDKQFPGSTWTNFKKVGYSFGTTQSEELEKNFGLVHFERHGEGRGRATGTSSTQTVSEDHFLQGRRGQRVTVGANSALWLFATLPVSV